MLTFKGGLSRYFDLFLAIDKITFELQGNLKILLYKDGKTPKRQQ